MKKLCFQHLFVHVAKNANKCMSFWYIFGLVTATFWWLKGFVGKWAAECQNKWTHLMSLAWVAEPSKLCGDAFQASGATFDHMQWKFAWLRKICKAGYTGLPECCWHFWLFQSEMLAASAKHLEEFCELLRSMHRDRETYWCAEAVGLLHYSKGTYSWLTYG